MSIKPLDFQIVLPKANDVGRMNQNELHKGAHDQQFAMQQTEKEDRKKQSVVIETKKSENNKINVDDERKKEKNSSKKEKRKNDRKKLNDQSVIEKEIVSSFDMRI